MQGFTYKYGDRPLEGYTIQRAAGRGGFGEVYYALSDSGREVALKVVQGYETIELRGISQCMNLKSPHLVTIFDVKYNDQGKPFVIMEFVNGPSLRGLLDESPSGLGTQKAAFFLREMAKGLTYLHDRGIVHRDLKPGNVFYEDGYVKIGDYGLSKAISASRHSGQTITVGTVHYMAPEIGEGRYDRSIDIYALGCMLYELLTGQTPYLGSSPGEILMKHLVEQPDLSGIEEPFASVIRKALVKDPKDRFQTVQEMVEAVFGAAHIQQSVSCFSPDSLTMVAGRVANKVAVGGPGSSGQIDLGAAQDQRPRGNPQAEELRERLANKFERIGQRLDQMGDRIGEKLAAAGERWEKKLDRLAGSEDGASVSSSSLQAPVVDAKRDPLARKTRVFLFLLTAGLIAGGTGALSVQSYGGEFPPAWFTCFMAITGAGAGLMAAGCWLGPGLKTEAPLVRHLAYGGLACLVGSILGLSAFGAADQVRAIMQARYATGTALSIAICLFLLDWSKIVDPARRERIVLGHALKAGLVGFVLCAIFGGNAPFVVGVLAGISLAVQIRSAFDPRAVRGPRRKVKVQADLEFDLGSNDGADRQQGRAQRRQQRREARAQRRQARWQGPVGSDGYPILPPGVSPRKRMVALILAAAWFVGFPGLHRFYVGRIGTGLLWFFTGGGLVIGQIIDAIRILNGQFTDRFGRRLVLWSDDNEINPAWPGRPPVQDAQKQPAPATSSAGSPETAASTPSPAAAMAAPASWHPDPWASQVWVRQNLTSPLLAFLSGLLMILSLVAGLIGTLSLPAITIMSAFDRELTEQPWYAPFLAGRWQGVLDSLQMGVSIGLMFAAIVVLILARRWAGGWHMIRGILGAAGLLAALHGFRLSLDFGGMDWPGTASLVRHGYMQEAINEILKRPDMVPMILTGGLMLLSILVLAWPARRHDPVSAAGKGV